MPVDSALSLESVSFLLVWTAISIYALAFIAYVVDLSRRSAVAVERSAQRELVSVGAGAASGDATTDAASAVDELRAEAA